jgi:hypothetical protein
MPVISAVMPRLFCVWGPAAGYPAAGPYGCPGMGGWGAYGSWYGGADAGCPYAV